MKKVFFFISVFLISSICLNAQTNRNKIKENSPGIYQAIANRAEKEWPNDYQMQAYVIDQQCNAFIEFVLFKAESLGIPDKVFGQIQIDALNEWSANKWDYCINEEDSFACMDSDWSMVVYVIKNQVEAYKNLH